MYQIIVNPRWNLTDELALAIVISASGSAATSSNQTAEEEEDDDDDPFAAARAQVANARTMPLRREVALCE
jgi:hypothetical protein